MLAACGGSSNNDATDATGSVDSQGLEPRIQLSLTAPAQVSLDITTVSEQSVTVGGVLQQQEISSDITVDVSLEQNGNDFQLRALSFNNGVSPDNLELSNLSLFRIIDTLNSRGEKTRFNQRRDLYDVLSLDVFSYPAFNLSVPSTPVGVGASWSEQNELPTVIATTRTSVDEININSISVNKLITTGSDEQDRYTVSGSMAATYALPSLLLQAADINVAVRFEDELYINGVLQTVVDDRTFTQTIREAAE
jgi:hypothetical protein